MGARACAAWGCSLSLRPFVTTETLYNHDCETTTTSSTNTQTTEKQEHIDYDLVESTNPAFGRAVVRVNVFRNHRQTVQFVQPQHTAALAHCELLVIDEAAAIPLPFVRAMLGPYLVFLCSTVNGCAIWAIRS